MKFTWPWALERRVREAEACQNEKNMLIAKLLAERNAAVEERDAARAREAKLAEQVRRMSER